MATADPKVATRAASAPSPKPSAPVPKPPAPAPALAVEPKESAGPIIERITIGSLMVKKTVYDDGDMEMAEVKTVKRGPDEKFKSWRHAQPVD